MIDLYFRAFSRARWDQFALNRGITEMSTDPQGNPIAVVKPNFYVDHIGNVVIEDAVYDFGTTPPTLITPANIDTWHSVNFRTVGKKFEEDQGDIYPGESDPPTASGGTYMLRFIRSKVVNAHRDQATVINLPFRGDTVRAYQIGSGDNRLQVLDPRDMVNFKPREWLGGMSW